MVALVLMHIVIGLSSQFRPNHADQRFITTNPTAASFFESTPLCHRHGCHCRKLDGAREEVGSSGDEEHIIRGGHHGRETFYRFRPSISATCTIRALDDDTFGHVLSRSPLVRNLKIIPGESTSKQLVTIPWKSVARKPALNTLDLSELRLSCECENSWLAFWPTAFTEPLVRAEVLRFLAARRRRRALLDANPSKPSIDGSKYLHVINEEPSCPHNCSLTIAELFHMPKMVMFDTAGSYESPPPFDLSNESNRANSSEHRRPFEYCLSAGISDERTYFARKCDLVRLALDVDRVIVNETDHVSITCSRLPIGENQKRPTGGSASASTSCPHLKLSPFISISYTNESGGANASSTVISKRQKFSTRCLSTDETIGEKLTASRNESGWLLCQEQNAYLPQASLAPLIVAGAPQIMSFKVDHSIPEQVHITFYVVGYPRPQFGWHNKNNDMWLKPNTSKGFEAILSSKPSFGHFIISGRAAFSELSMNCFQGEYDFVVCNGYGCDQRDFAIAYGMPSGMCPIFQMAPFPTLDPVTEYPSNSSDNRTSIANQTGSIQSSSTERSHPTMVFADPPNGKPKDEKQENWIYIAVPFLVVFAVVLVGVLTTCLFLRLIGGGGVGSHQSSTRKSSTTSRYNKTRPSLTDWELSPLNPQRLPNFEVNSSYVDWLHSINGQVRVFPAGELSIIKELGEGAFGRVFLAKVIVPPPSETEEKGGAKETSKAKSEKTSTKSSPAKSQSVDGEVGGGVEQYYALKLLKNVTPEKLEDLEREAAIMSQLDHPNIVQFFGLSSKGGTLTLLFEYMEHGDLVNYLRNHNPETDGCHPPLRPNDLLMVAIQIAKGLEYLAERHLVHRDLAARNCLVGKDMTVKISDFGMTRDIYITDYYKMGSRTLVPLRWLPPESILYRKFTVESDIWSFGVLLWEIFSYGKIPWYMHSNCEVLEIIQNGKLLERPDGAPDEIYDHIMLKCWSKSPLDRMSATGARKKLEELIEARLRYCNILPSYSDDALDTVVEATKV